jgi:conjugative transfer signal peptidase TraF
MLGIGLLAILSPRADHPRVLWNASRSVPIGLYLVTPRTPASGDLAVVRLPGAIHALAVARGYLGASALLIKPVAAGPHDVVCRHGQTVTINGRVVAHARNADASGRLLLRWSACLTLAEGQLFVLSAGPDSFDSRYFGPVDRIHVLGSGHPIWQARPFA